MKNGMMKYFFWTLIFGFVSVNLFSQSLCGDITITSLGVPDSYTFEVINLDSLDGPYSYFWDFGNGTFSSDSTPVNSFTGFDTLNVCVTVNGFLGGTCDDCITIYVPGSGPNLVWPGDINNNGIANNVDLLYLGNAFQSNGPPRQDMTTEWSPHAVSQPWQAIFPNGTDISFADGDGDSIIDTDDLIPIIENYNKIHPPVFTDTFSTGQVGLDPPLVLAFAQDSVFEGAAYQIPIVLGDQQFPVNDFYGLAFSIDYDTSFIDPANVFVTWNTSSWVSQVNFSDILTIEHNDPGLGRLELGLSRISHVPISGFGEIGTLHIIMEDNISGLQPGQQVPMQVKVDDVLMVNELLEVLTIIPSDWSTNVVATSIIEIPELEETITIFPNPAKDHLNITTEKLKISEIELYNSLGQLTLKQFFENRQEAHLYLPELVPGIYFLRIKTNKNYLSAKIIID